MLQDREGKESVVSSPLELTQIARQENVTDNERACASRAIPATSAQHMSHTSGSSDKQSQGEASNTPNVTVCELVPRPGIDRVTSSTQQNAWHSDVPRTNSTPKLYDNAKTISKSKDIEVLELFESQICLRKTQQQKEKTTPLVSDHCNVIRTLSVMKKAKTTTALVTSVTSITVRWDNKRITTWEKRDKAGHGDWHRIYETSSVKRGKKWNTLRGKENLRTHSLNRQRSSVNGRQQIHAHDIVFYAAWWRNNENTQSQRFHPHGLTVKLSDFTSYGSQSRFGERAMRG